MYCRKCGKEIPDNSTFCNICGSSQAENEAMYRPLTKQQKKTSGCGLAVIGSLLSVLALIIIGAMLSTPDSNESTYTPPTPSVEEAKEDKQKNEQPTTIPDNSTNEIVYRLKSGELGKYGRIVTLNAGTDMPVDKYLYKLPAGEYTATTTSDIPIGFFIVKDETTTEDNTNYPEILDYVSDSYMLTAGDDDLNGTAQKQAEFTLNEDESIQIPDASNGREIIITAKNKKDNTIETAEIKNESESVTIYETDGIKISYLGLENTKRKAAINLLIENNTDTDRMIQVRDFSINGYMVEPVFSTNVSANKKSYDSINIYNSELEENRIASIDTVDFKFWIVNSDDWTIKTETEQITITIN